MAETYSAGIVTAYGAAVRGGYTGTYEQWCQDMANLGDNVAEVRTKAAQAAQSAGNAAGSATAAAGSAGSAAGSASEAASSAGNAAGSATAAAESATDAAGSATNAASSATAAEDAQGKAEDAQGKAEDAQEAAEQAQSDAETAAQSVSQSAAQISQNASDISDLKSAKAPVIIDTSSGTIASFVDGADGMQLKSLTVNIEPVQEGRGDPSPTNVRPISGWTGCNIFRSGADTSAPAVIPISWQSEAGTVYGGTLDVTTGMLTVEWQNINIPKYGNIIVIGGASCYRFTNADVKQDGYRDKYICTHFGKPNVIYDNPQNGQIANQYGNAYNIVLRNDNLTTLTEWNTWLDEQVDSGNPVKLCYKLVTPVEYQLTPTEVTTLLGENNIWADCGPVSVDYPADTKLFIQKINAPTDDDMTADSQIASGKYFIIGNNLYLSTTTIPAGDTIIPGTNCQQTNLAAALNALNA